MRPYGKKYIGGLCGHADRCGEEAPRRYRRTVGGRAELRTLKRRARAKAVREAYEAARECY